MANEASITEVLATAGAANAGSMEALLPVVYEQLRALAGSYLHRGGSHTLQPTALVHEAFLKMVGADRRWSGRDHFMAVAAKAMRQVLVDHARRKTAEKRGGGIDRADVTIETLSGPDTPHTGPTGRDVRVLELDDLLKQLAKLGERPARVAEMRLFGGMDMDQIARVLDLSRMTVHRDWEIARAWLAAKVTGADLA
jgi:RNA polymerase sigma factor (TIGR02999 family)